MAEPLVITISHRMTKDEAKARLQSGFGQFRAQFPGLEERWSEDRMEFRLGAFGQSVTGHIDVLADAVRIELQLPGLLGWFGRTIGRRLGQHVTLLLEKK